MVSLVAATLLFILLSPGFLLTLPPVGDKIFMSYKTSLFSILVHSLVFAVALLFLNKIEGFATARKSKN
uniref:Uncharacterized protein n=1 Tax=viral metagenome TaxID=1070528 RepID=A0A6C0JXC8_9ZZZZ